jgi:hypothetical protein
VIAVEGVGVAQVDHESDEARLDLFRIAACEGMSPSVTGPNSV